MVQFLRLSTSVTPACSSASPSTAMTTSWSPWRSSTDSSKSSTSTSDLSASWWEFKCNNAKKHYWVFWVVQRLELLPHDRAVMGSISAAPIIENLVVHIFLTSFLMGLSLPLFLYFCLFYIIQLTYKFLPMLGIEQRISGVGSDRSANCSTTTALAVHIRWCYRTCRKWTGWRNVSLSACGINWR